MLRKRDIISAGKKRYHTTLRTAAAFVIACFVVNGNAVKAETLNKALINSYIKNPTLNAQRAVLRSTDEGVAIAKSGFRPIITGSATFTHEDSNTSGDIQSRLYTVRLTQPIFRGFRTINTLRQAEAEVLAGREDLRIVEQNIFIDTVTAYMDVIRDKAIVKLRRNNVKVLTKQLRATQDRFKIRDKTKTDVAQARARLSGAISQLSLAKANLEASKATYQRVVGHMPGRLVVPNGLSKYIPKSLRVAQDIGLAEHPSILSANYREQSAKHAVRIIIGELLPDVTGSVTYADSQSNSALLGNSETTTLQATANVPIYQGGSVSARIRQAKQTRVQRQRQITEARLNVKAQIIAAWGQWEAAKAKLVSDRTQVEASKSALEGVKAEEGVGERTVLDVLDAEQSFLDAQVALSTTKRDYIVAGYALLSAIGRLGASDLNLSVPLYDETRYYDKVKGKWFGFGRSGIRKNKRN